MSPDIKYALSLDREGSLSPISTYFSSSILAFFLLDCKLLSRTLSPDIKRKYYVTMSSDIKYALHLDTNQQFIPILCSVRLQALGERLSFALFVSSLAKFGDSQRKSDNQFGDILYLHRTNHLFQISSCFLIFSLPLFFILDCKLLRAGFLLHCVSFFPLPLCP